MARIMSLPVSIPHPFSMKATVSHDIVSKHQVVLLGEDSHDGIVRFCARGIDERLALFLALVWRVQQAVSGNHSTAEEPRVHWSAFVQLRHVARSRKSAGFGFLLNDAQNNVQSNYNDHPSFVDPRGRRIMQRRAAFELVRT